MKIVLFGKNGQLGWELRRTLACLGEICALDYPEVDFSQPDGVAALIERERPGLVVNAAAYTAVDRAESEPRLAGLINAVTPGAIARAARRVGAGFIHYSTDYVFDGTKGCPYDEQDVPHPLNGYGSTKLEGEQAIQNEGGTYWIFRTSWVYSSRRDSFVSKVLKWSRENKVLRVVGDQVSNPTWARALAEATAVCVGQGGRDPVSWIGETQGLYHLAGDGYASRLEWAQEIIALDAHPEEQIAERVEPALSSEFVTPATRPAFSALNCERFGSRFGFSLPDWRSALKLAMEGNG